MLMYCKFEDFVFCQTSLCLESHLGVMLFLLERFTRFIFSCRYIQCAHHRIHHIQPADYDEFVGIVSAARKVSS